MTLIVEDGTGLINANSYNGIGFITSYLTQRGLNTIWDTKTVDEQKAAAIASTDYIDIRFGRRFKGSKLNTDISVAASNILIVAVLPTDGDTVTIDATVYTFKETLASAFDVLIGGTPAATAANLVSAITGAAGAGSTYGMGTTTHATATAATLNPGSTVKVSAITSGVLADDIATLSSNEDSCIWDGVKLTGGANDGEQSLEFPRLGAYSPSWVLYTGIPLELKQAHAEYANRAVSAALLPDPVTDPTGRLATKTFKKVGPIETELQYSNTSFDNIIKKYPAADKLLSPLLKPAGGVIR